MEGGEPYITNFFYLRRNEMICLVDASNRNSPYFPRNTLTQCLVEAGNVRGDYAYSPTKRKKPLPDRDKSFFLLFLFFLFLYTRKNCDLFSVFLLLIAFFPLFFPRATRHFFKFAS
jgi:hypothetical protein